MTEKIHSLSTHTVPPSQTTVLTTHTAPTLLSHVSSKIETVDEEPYTIKCICPFADDDGNTIYCETCDSWQHIECYYPNNIQDALKQEDFAHSCVDCKPRPLDRIGAVERQKLRRIRINATQDIPEKKSKRPPSKSHKKRTKPNDLQLNGQSGSDTNSKHSVEPQGHKKPKSAHRPSHSTSSSTKRSPSYGQKNGNIQAHPPSPANTPPDVPADCEIHQYSSSFMTLYNDDRDLQIVQTNSFAGLEISNIMSLWLRDHDKLAREVGWDFKDVFQTLPPNIGAVKRTPTVSHKKKMLGDTVIHFQFLSTPQSIGKDTPLVELNGQLGFQKDYCSDEMNQWKELSSPLPFVFFHPILPLYIDTRREGSLARYVRRSCKPNAAIDTYLSEGSEYQFWLVSDRLIEPNEQITIAWDFRFENGQRGRRAAQLLGLDDTDPEGLPDYDPKQADEYQGLLTWIQLILSEHGGCACDRGEDCAFTRFFRKYIERSPTKSSSRRKSRKPRTHAVSPTSTGPATNSRAPSEGHGEDGAENDSGSSRSKPPSRDTTPARQGSFDTLGILTEPTDRDKRKVAMVEDTFRRMEQQQPPRKKKRTSDGTGGSSTSKGKRNSSGHTPGLPNGTDERRYMDAGTNRSMSGSPHSASIPNAVHLSKDSTSRHGSMPIPSRHSSEGPRPEYCDASIQTDPVEGEWFSPARQTPKIKRRVVSLSKRLLDNRYRLRADMEEQRRLSAASPTSVASAILKMDLSSPKDTNSRLSSPVAAKDAIAGAGPLLDSAGDTQMANTPLVSPSDSQANPPADTPNVSPKLKAPELRVQLPPVPPFNSVPAIITSTTPVATTANMVQSPLSSTNLSSPFGLPAVNGVATHPSPVKKKLSLSDYKSRMNKAAAAKPVGASLKPSGSTVTEESRSPTTTDVPMADSPITEKPNDH